jgi:cobyrinic acid a,c-diamide synthase
MYLSRAITWQGNTAEMVGVIPGTISMSSRPHGRGYIQLRETDDALWPGGEEGKVIAGHEFHYSQLEGLPSDARFAYDVLRGAGIQDGKDGYVYKNLLASYAHLRDSGQNHWVERFVAFVDDIKRNRVRKDLDR